MHIFSISACFVQLAYYLFRGYFEGIHPGANCVPCRQYIDADEDQLVWKKQLGYVSGVLSNIHQAAYVRNMVKYEKILNNTASNGFLYIFDDMSQETARLSATVHNLVSDVTTRHL